MPTPFVPIVDPDPTGAVRGEILSELRRFNRHRASDPMFAPLTVVAYDAEGVLAGGLVGEFGWQWLHVDLLWVAEPARGRGLGSRLLQRAEDEARIRECRGVYLDSFDFQAPGFYLKRGYRVFGVLEDYPPGSRQTYFAKRLDEAPATSASPD